MKYLLLLTSCLDVYPVDFSVSLSRQLGVSINSTTLWGSQQFYHVAGITTGPLALFHLFFWSLNFIFCNRWILQSSTLNRLWARHSQSDRKIRQYPQDTSAHYSFLDSFMANTTSAFPISLSDTSIATQNLHQAFLLSTVSLWSSRTFPSWLKSLHQAFLFFNFTVQNLHQAFLLSTISL